MFEEEFTVPRQAMCPNCGLAGDKHCGDPGGHAPGPNDITMCMACGKWLMFNDDMTLRSMEYEDFKPLPFGQKLAMARVKCKWLAITREVVDEYKKTREEGKT